MKPVLMIHEVTDALFELPLHNFLLTFDDGYASQYDSRLNGYNRIYFIITDFIGKEGYLTLEQVKELSKDPLVTIGAHSHAHLNLKSLPTVFDRVQHIDADTRIMVSWFKENLGACPKMFCFPYNEDLKGMYPAILTKFGFTEFYGRERIPVERLLYDESLLDSHGTLIASA